MPFAVELFELKLFVDDPGGAISVHAGAGLWGDAGGGDLCDGGSGDAWAADSGAACGRGDAAGLCAAGGVWGELDAAQDCARSGWIGMGIARGWIYGSWGAGAYPEFVVHSDEFVPR